MKIWLLVLSLLSSTVASAQMPLARAVAVTFDDLPFASVPADDDATLKDMTDRLLGSLKAAGAPAVGFVNEAKLYREGSLDEARVQLLRHWLTAGFELGNHTYSHPSLNRISLEAFEADFLRGETVTRSLVRESGGTLHWFRHPFLHLGRTPEVRADFQRFLDEHGYRVAPVTVNSSEWIFAVAYARAQAQGDAASAQRIGDAYVPYMEQVFARAEQMSLDLFGRTISQVVVLHANTLNADYFSRLAGMLVRRGYRFISLEEALQDKAYASHLGISLDQGESWLANWSRVAGFRPSAPTTVPEFVMHWAGPAAIRGY